MVSITKEKNNYIFNIKGFHKIWALRSSITVPKENIVNAYQDIEELQQWAGFRVGTYLPFVIIAGNYYKKGKRNFWDVMKEKNTIIVELQNHSYHKLYIQVENPQEAIQLLNSK